MILSELDVAWDYSGYNRDMTGACGCFACLRTFDASEIKDWSADQGQTARCPLCNVDTVLPAAKTRIDESFLRAMNTKFLGGQVFRPIQTVTVMETYDEEFLHRLGITSSEG